MKSAILLATLAVMLGLSWMNLHHGNLNQDEGWYLLAARSVSEGKLPYRDFAYTQAPVLPFVYSVFAGEVREQGIWFGRVVTQVFGLLSLLFAALLAARLNPLNWRLAFLFCLVLGGINTFQSYYTTVVKTYGLCACFLTLGCLLGACVDRKRWWVAPLCGLVLALAAGTRISAGLGLPVMGIYLLCRRRSLGDLPWLTFGLGGAAGLGLIFGPLYLAAPEGLVFGIVKYHAGRVAENALTLKAGFLSRLAQDYLVAFVALPALLMCRFWPGEVRPWPILSGVRGFGIMGAVLLLLVTVLHLSASFPYDDYQVILFPLFCALLAVPLASIRVGWLLPLVFLASLGAAGSSPINQEWFIQGRDRVWWKSKQEPDLLRLQKTADEVAKLAGQGTNVVLLTQDAYLAVEANLAVPPGLEMGPFAYYPAMSDEDAALLHLHNRASLTRLLENSEAPVAAFSGYSLSIDCPQVSELPADQQAELWRIVEQRYQPAFEVEHFGQGHTTLKILRRRP